MNNQELKGIITALEKVSGEQKRVTGNLLEKLELITESLIKIVYNHDMEDNLKMFDFKYFGFRLAGSQHGKYIHFVALQNDTWEGFNLLPTKTNEINSNFYYHGDFNCNYSYMTRSEILDACEVLPEFIQNMVSKIQGLTDKEQKFLQQFEKLEV